MGVSKPIKLTQAAIKLIAIALHLKSQKSVLQNQSCGPFSGIICSQVCYSPVAGTNSATSWRFICIRFSCDVWLHLDTLVSNPNIFSTAFNNLLRDEKNWIFKIEIRNTKCTTTIGPYSMFFIIPLNTGARWQKNNGWQLDFVLLTILSKLVLLF